MNGKILSNIRWRSHAMALIFMAVALVMLILSGLYHNQSKQSLKMSEQNYQSQLSANRQAKKQLNVLKEELPAYQQLKESGRIGDADRLNWIESLRDASKATRIPEVNFSVGPAQRVTERNSRYWVQGLTLNKSEMKLTMRLAHEADFYLFMNRLAKESRGVFSIESCTLKRDMNKLLAGMDALCKLDWYNLDDLTSSWTES